MSILIDKDTTVMIQGITGAYGRNQAKRMLDYGTRVVAGVSPGKGGQEVWGVPVYNSAAEAAAEHPFHASVIYVPAPSVFSAATEAIAAGAKLMLIGTEGLPLQECMRLRAIAARAGTWLVGPNTIGMIEPGKCLIGSLAAEYGKPGRLGIVTRGGTTAIEMVRLFSEAGIGQSVCVGCGGDKVLGRNPAAYLELLEEDPETDAVLLVGEIGGRKENECAEVVKRMKKPVFAYILGRCAPKGVRMGHIGAIINGRDDTFEAKCEVLGKAGATIVYTPWEAIEKVRAALAQA